MRKVFFLIVVVAGVHIAKAQQIDLIKYEKLEELIRSSADKLTVVNFWATWCGPCIQELPYFVSADNISGVNVILVSLDFPDEREKVERFVMKKMIEKQIYLLDEKDYDDYMGKVSEDWSGAIPATLMVEKNGRRHFFEKPFTEKELTDQINNYLN